MTEESIKRDGTKPINANTIRHIPEGHTCFGDGKTYVLCSFCSKKLSIGTIAEHSKVSSNSTLNSRQMRCVECYDLIHSGPSARTIEEQEIYMQTPEYLEVAKIMKGLERRREETLNRNKEKGIALAVSKEVFEEALKLYYMHGWPYTEIAKKFNVSTGVVAAWCTNKIKRFSSTYKAMMEMYDAPRTSTRGSSVHSNYVYREVFRLRYEENLGYKEISKRTGVAHSTISHWFGNTTLCFKELYKEMMRKYNGQRTR